MTSTLTASEVARRVGWTRRFYGRDKADDGKVLALLGLRPVESGNGYTNWRKTLSVDDALALMRALDLDPMDVGL